ncbi:MAG: F0F1 ATP synthase subunit gamma [Geodermatophilaceae bacterium]|nr:F0F1 ATP synthase subunit gamma [Geodermatophilaceae bacterium]MDQ3476009.1 F0F1 ATP synthase subunit gamma [Actinomycetota bacterium]
MAQIREIRRRISSVSSTKKITRAMELIATTRIAKAQQRVQAALPYAREITRALSSLAATASLDHPLLVERDNPKRAAVLVVTSDRGLAGGYTANAVRAAEELSALLRSEGKEPLLYVIGRKGIGYYSFRQRTVAHTWSGFSEQPTYADARDVASTLIKAFLAGVDDEGDDGGEDGVLGVDEIHLVHTRFVSMLSQEPTANRIAPLVVEEVEHEEDESSRMSELQPSYEFEPDPDTLLDALLPTYVTSRIYAALLESAASESAARRRAMKAATDNADELIRGLTRDVNQARQAQITQEISEIVGGADALVSVGSDE